MTENGDGPVLLDRLSDRFFKYLFAREEHKDLLIAFLNEVLLDLDPDESARRIEDVTYGDRESSPLYRDAKLPRFDVIARAEDGRVFHIEVQVAKDPYFLERSLYYAAMSYSLQLRKGGEYHVLMPVIFVGLLDFEAFPSTSRDEDYHSLHRILDVRAHRWEMKGMEFHFLELPKLRRRGSGPRTGLDRLLSYLGNVGGVPAMQELAQVDSRVERMMQLESLFTRDPDLLRDYLIALRDRLDYEYSFKWARIDGLTEGRAEGMAQGMAQGVAQGMAQGVAQGEAKGRVEGRAEGMADTARRMLARGLSPEQIVEYTDLSLDEIRTIKARMSD